MATKEKKMNPADDGYFHYNGNFPPLYVEPPETQKKDYEKEMENALLTYLQESYKTGIKDSNAILSSGLSAGEAGVLYIRRLRDKRRK